MKYESRAIALSYIKHGENSIIAKLFTEEKGLQSFIIKGVRTNKSKKKLGLFQPLELSIINATYLPKKNLQYLASINLSDSKKQNGTNITKKFLSLFVAEVISKILQEHRVDKPLFLFVWQLKTNLSNSSMVDPNFPLQFLIYLSKHIGFLPLYA